MRPDPIELAKNQLERDRRATQAYPRLLQNKLARMTASPLAYLRGSAPLFYELLQQHPELAEGPPGNGVLVGDAHLENFGAFRCEPEPSEDTAPTVFDVNDFDEAIVGPLRVDVLRLMTSIILGGRELGSSGQQSIELCRSGWSGYLLGLQEPARKLEPPPPVLRLLAKVASRSQRELLDARTEERSGKRRFVRGERYFDLEPDLAHKARAAFADYVNRLDQARKEKPESFEIEDAAFRIAGCGSLGSLRVAVLTRGKGGGHSWLFDMKAEGSPAAASWLGEPSDGPAERVLKAMRTCLARPPRMLGATHLDGIPCFVRRLSPREDKLALSTLRSEELGELARYLGTLLGRVHYRGALGASPECSERDGTELILRAVRIAGIHESAYLTLCQA